MKKFSNNLFNKKNIDILYNSGVYLLFTFAIVVVLTSILWLIKLPITVFNLPISFLIAGIILYKKENKNSFIPILLAVLVFLVSILLSSHVFDQSDDGNSYHKETIGMINSGWNPIWDDYEEFAKENNLTSNHALWANHYPKTTWIIGSSIYKLTSNIESAKCYNVFILFIGFCIFLKHLTTIIKSKYIAILISLLICINPITMSQILSLYLDGFMGILLFIIIFDMYMYVKNKHNFQLYVSLASALILIINTKFTGFAYAGLFCLGFYLYYLYFSIKDKKYREIKNSIIYFGVTVIIGVIIVGSTSYVKNIIDHKVPFYPLMGEDKVDIMTYLQPASFATSSPIEKNFYSIFSKTANIGVFNNSEPELKLPFTTSYYELTQISYDTRIGGYGLLFSGILIISIIIIIVTIINLIIKKQYNDLALLLIPLITIGSLLLFLSDGWWARYAPYLYLIVIIALIILGSSDKKLIKILLILFSIIIFINSSINFMAVAKRDLPKSGQARMNFEKLEGKEIDIYLTNSRFSGILYNLDDYNIKYNIISDSKDMDSLYANFVHYK